MPKLRASFWVLSLIFILGCAQTSSPPSSSEVQDDDVARFEVSIQNFRYNPDTITVKQGQKVIITVQNLDSVGHGIFLDAFGVSDGVGPGQSKTAPRGWDQHGLRGRGDDRSGGYPHPESCQRPDGE